MSDKKIRAIFYLTPFKWKYLLSWKKIKKYMVNWAISARTMSKYSHCEIQTDESQVFYEEAMFLDGKALMFGVHGTCYTSTLRGKSNGTVSRPASEVLDHSKHWSYIEIPVTDKQYSSLITWMDYQVKNNNGYSKWDLLKFIFPVHFPDEQRNICSEFVNNGLAAIKILDKFGIISPKQVAKRLIKKGYTMKDLS